MPAHMKPVSGLRGFTRHMSAVAEGTGRAYSVYCALLYTVAEGADAEIARYVATHWDELDAMTSNRCLVFVIGETGFRYRDAGIDYSPQRVPGGSTLMPDQLSPAQVYRVADYLGVRPTALPCAAFFVRPQSSREVLRLRLADYVPDASDPEQMTRSFRGIATATETCRKAPMSERLDCLREELVRERERMVPRVGPSPAERVDAAAATVESVEKVLVSSTTIAGALLRVLGF